MTKPQGIVLWRGASRLNDKPVTAVATGLHRPSENEKTGPMVQVYILPMGNPMSAVRTGSDASVCGTCPQRPSVGGGCYVTIFRGPREVWESLRRDLYPDVTAREARQHLAGRMVRLGAWGDPAAVPVQVWRSCLRDAAGWTGYTHAWRRFPSLRSLCMASVDSDTERAEAWRRGWRTFRVTSSAPGPGEITCPAAPEAGKLTTCHDCGLCDGHGARWGARDQRRSIVIRPHGYRAARFQETTT